MTTRVFFIPTVRSASGQERPLAFKCKTTAPAPQGTGTKEYDIYEVVEWHQPHLAYDGTEDKTAYAQAEEVIRYLASTAGTLPEGTSVMGFQVQKVYRNS